MDTENAVPEVPQKPKRSVMRRIGKYLFRTLIALIVIGIVAQLIYTFSGSSEWVNLGTRKGVTVYSMKIPGSSSKKFKATWKIRSTLSKFVMFSTEEESDMSVGYYDMRDIAKPSQQLIWSTWKQKFPAPFRPRQFVVRQEFSQDPKTKEFLFRVIADPDKIPAEDCCVRVPVMNNTWRLQPLPNGEIEVEWLSDMEMGGFFPYFAANAYQPGGMWYFARRVQGYLDRDKYKNAKYDWIQEVQPTVAAQPPVTSTPAPPPAAPTAPASAAAVTP